MGRGTALASLAAGGEGDGTGTGDSPVVDHLRLGCSETMGQGAIVTPDLARDQELRHSLRADFYDAVLDLQGALRSAMIGRLAKASRRIGEAPSARVGSPNGCSPNALRRAAQHVIEQDVDLARRSPVTTGSLWKPRLPVDEEAESWCDRNLGASDTRPVALINPGAGWGAKRWPVDRYAAVGDNFLERGFRVLVNAGPGEEPLANEIAAATGSRAEPIFPKLGQLIAVTRRIDLCIAGDTGPLHLACALGRPVVGIYGPTDPARNGPFGTRFRVLRSPESRRDHSRRAEPEAGLLTIQPEDVLRAAEELLAEESSR